MVRDLSSEDEAYWLCEDEDGKRIGVLIAFRDGDRWKIFQLEVDPEHRRRGIARELLSRLGDAEIVSLVNSDHVDAWLHLGFTAKAAGPGAFEVSRKGHAR